MERFGSRLGFILNINEGTINTGFPISIAFRRECFFSFNYKVSVTKTKPKLFTLPRECGDPVIKAFYDRLRLKGKLHNVAMVACIRKMLSILNSMERNNTEWQDNYVAEIK